MKRVIIFFAVIFFFVSMTAGCNRNRSIGIIGGADGPTAIFVSPGKPVPQPTAIPVLAPSLSPTPEPTMIESVSCTTDMDGDGLNDAYDILEGARKDAENKPRYKDAYYSGGYPPDHEGVCTDVIWRAFKNAGYMLKDMIDEDIRSNVALYPRVKAEPEPNIDFRRVKNLRVFFDRHATSLTTEIIPGDAENLKEWQTGDIVVFDDPAEHIAVVSDQRNEEGVPLIIHNCGPYTQENDMLLYWHENYSPIIKHYRFPANNTEENEKPSGIEPDENVNTP